MSYDRIWLCPSLNRETWHEVLVHEPQLRQAEGLPSHDRYSVKVSAGENFLFDELYCFVNEQDARQFFEHDVQKREFVNDDGHGLGFDDICLRVNGREIVRRQVTSKPVASSK